MNIGKTDFLTVASQLRRQAEAEQALLPEVFDDSNLWMAAISLLALALGDAEAYWVNHWIYETEFGRYPDDALPARTDEEFWDFLCSRLQ